MKELSVFHNKDDIKNIINKTNFSKLIKSTTIETGIKYSYIVTGELKLLVINFIDRFLIDLFLSSAHYHI